MQVSSITNAGKDLSGKEVSSRADYIAAIETLRTPAGAVPHLNPPCPLLL